MTDALDRYLARPDADDRVVVARSCASPKKESCPAYLGLLALAEELERARGKDTK